MAAMFDYFAREHSREVLKMQRKGRKDWNNQVFQHKYIINENKHSK